MAALTKDAHRYISSLEGGQPRVIQKAHSQETNTVVYAGAALMIVSGTARPVAAGNVGALFAGFAAAKSDATGIATGTMRPDIIQEGYVDLEVAGTLAVNDLVYASTDNDFHDADGAGGSERVIIGKVHTLIGADGFAGHTAQTCRVFFQATAMQVG
jgi:hypothetical protein